MLALDSIKAISLDLDDTLWPTDPVIAKAEQALIAWFAQHAPVTGQHWAQPGTADRARQTVKRANPEKLHDFSFLRLEMIRHAMQEAGDGTANAEAAFAAFFAARQQVELFEESLPALQALAARYPLQTLSNGNADIALIGLDAHFKGTVTARLVGYAKPDPRIFHTAAEQLGLGVHEVLHVGDDPLLDVEGARKVGMPVVWVNRHGKAWPCDSPAPVQVRDLSQLVERLALV